MPSSETTLKAKAPAPAMKDCFEIYKIRSKELKDYRKDADGIPLETLLRQADTDYELAPLNPWNRKRKTNSLYQGLDMRDPSNRVNLNTENWQSDNSDSSIFSKIQTALSLLFDRNPEAVLYPKSKKFEAETELAKAIFMDSLDKEKFKDKVKLFVFNMSKYGWGYARTSVLETSRIIYDLATVNPLTDEKQYEKRELRTCRPDFRSLNNWNVWVDENAKPYQKDTINDWMFREVYTDEKLFQEFGKGGRVRKASEEKKRIDDLIDSDGGTVGGSNITVKRNEVFFYENKEKDFILAVCNGEPIWVERLPVHKELSLLTGFWNLRDSEKIYGIGICEILRQDKNLLDKIRNMSVDQLVLSIYKMYFYDGSLDSEEADLKIRPGRGQKVLDPSKIKWLEVPSGGAEAYERESLLRQNMEEASGITKTMSGGVSADRDVKALAIQQSRDAALSKLKVALDNILSMLEDEARLRWPLIQEINMTPLEVQKITDPEKISLYLQEINVNEELFYHDTTEQVIYALRYPVVKAKIKKNDEGIYRPSEQNSFFDVTPERIRWMGDIKYSAESILVANKELNKQMDLEMANLLIPLFAGDPKTNLKPAKQILKIYGKDQEDWLPEEWLRPTPPPEPQAAPAPEGAPAPGQPIPGPETVVPPSEVTPGDGTTNIVDKNRAYSDVPMLPQN